MQNQPFEHSELEENKHLARRTERTIAKGIAGLGLALTVFVGGALSAQAHPGATAPTYYLPSEASFSETPTYETDRAATHTVPGSTRTVTNGQDYDHYCKANWQAQTQVSGGTATTPTGSTMAVAGMSTEPAFTGNNGLLYLNQWFNDTQTNPYFRVVWATDFATTNSTLTIKSDGTWVPGTLKNGKVKEYSTDGASLAQELEIWSGASKYRTYDWATSTLGLHNTTPYNSTETYLPGPYPGVSEHLFSLNPTVKTTNWAYDSSRPLQTSFDDPYYPVADQYVPNLDPDDPHSFANAASYDPATQTLTFDLGDQPAGAMIVIEVPGLSANGYDKSRTNETFGVTANFTGDYVGLDATNTVCYPVEVTWNNVDSDTGAALTGGQWALEPIADTAQVTGSAEATSDTGSFAIRNDVPLAPDEPGGFTPGTWSLREVSAPSGYLPRSDAHEFTVDFKNPTVDLGEIGSVAEPVAPRKFG